MAAVTRAGATRTATAPPPAVGPTSPRARQPAATGRRLLDWPGWAPWLARAVLLIGVLDLISAVTRPERGRVMTLLDVLPLGLVHAAAAVTTAVGVVLIMLSRGLRRHKQRAWLATVALLAGSVGLHIAKGLDVEEAVLSAALLGLLLAARRHFGAEGDRRTRWRALAVTAQLLALDVVLGSLLVGTGGARDVDGDRSVLDTVATAVRGLAGVNGPLSLRGRRGDAIGDILLALGLLTVVTAAYLVLRTSQPTPQLSAEDEVGLRRLLARHGELDSLGYFALRRDKSAVFSPSGKAAVAYRVLNGVLLASGDPLGDPEAWPGAIKEAQELARRHAWTCAVMGCSETGAEAWRRVAGLDALELGDEAVVAVCDFTLEGRAMRNVRQAVARVERAGYATVVSRLGDIDPEERRRLREQAARWRGAETERGFSMALGRLGEPADDACVLVAASREGQLAAFLHFVPWGEHGLSLDLMRRDRECDNGINELLIVAALQAAASLGVDRVSLNFAVFRSALERGSRIGAGPVLRLWRGLLVFASRWFQIESLYRFNAKFRPVWEPRFICYPNAREVPRIAVAALEAEAFLVRPTWRGTREALGRSLQRRRAPACEPVPLEQAG